jgi:hypothetical protein
MTFVEAAENHVGGLNARRPKKGGQVHLIIERLARRDRKPLR